MSDHLPECERWFTNMPDSDECPTCEMFRACEQRVAEETEAAMMEFFYWKPSPPHDRHYFADNICAYCVGREVALIAARDAVMSLPPAWEHPEHPEMQDIDKAKAIAAIDALREKP